MSTIELKGLTFRVEHHHDGDTGAPWDSSDGHGSVRSVRYSGYVPKGPGERVLHAERGHAWLYDLAGAVETAKRDHWGVSTDAGAALVKALGREPTEGEIARAAVDADFRFLQGWCDGSWSYVGVVVTLLDVDGYATSETESLWGVESDASDYLDETARELAGEIARRVSRRKYIETRVRVRS